MNDLVSVLQSDQAVTTTANSPDLLKFPYTMDQLEAWIRRKIGGGIFDVELEKGMLADCIMEALNEYSQWRPRVIYGTIAMLEGRTQYLKDIDCGQGVAKVDFVENRPTPTEIYYGNLLTPTPIAFRGLDVFELYSTWRKTWMRITSIAPNWLYDNVRKVLWIHNPIARYSAGIVCYGNYLRTEQLDAFGSQWVSKYALALARYQLADVLSKYAGVVPGAEGDLTLDQGKRQDAKETMTKLLEELKGAQEFAPISID